MMKQTFWASSLGDAMQQVQDVLGLDAMILDTVEEVDPHTGVRKFGVSAATEADSANPTPARQIHQTTTSVNTSEIGPSSSEPPTAERALIESLLGRLESLQGELETLRGARAEWAATQAACEDLSNEVGALSRAVHDLTSSGPEAEQLAQVDDLIRGGVDECVAEAITERMIARGNGSLPNTKDRARELALAIRTTEPLWDRKSHTRAALIGPSGAGKTSTLVKIAAETLLGCRKKVGVISIDTQRIGRVEAINTYGELLGVQVCIASDRSELVRALNSLSECDLVLIDCWGCSPWDETEQQKLNELFDGLHIERHLVLPATWRSQDIRQVLSDSDPGELTSLILTKLDEARGAGAALSATWSSHHAVSHVCCGSEVPGGIAAADSWDLAEQILEAAA